MSTLRPIPEEDHPRMRGVYMDYSHQQAKTPGSSPHARGLLATIMSGRLVSGIIPACAGFTPGPEGPVEGDRDHPRMRGVYFRVDPA